MTVCSAGSTFCMEYSSLTNARNDAPVVQVTSKEQKRRLVYTMTPVGRTLQKTEATCHRFFAALKALDDSGWFHGDARYPIEKILWVDFFRAGKPKGEKEVLVSDKVTLALSFVDTLDLEVESDFIGKMCEVHDSDDNSYSMSSSLASNLGRERGVLLQG